MKGSNVTVCLFVVQASYLRYLYIVHRASYTYIHTYIVQPIKVFNPNRTSTLSDLHSLKYTYTHTYIHAMLQCVHLLFKHHIYVIHTTYITSLDDGGRDSNSSMMPHQDGLASIQSTIADPMLTTHETTKTAPSG